MQLRLRPHSSGGSPVRIAGVNLLAKFRVGSYSRLQVQAAWTPHQIRNRAVSALESFVAVGKASRGRDSTRRSSNGKSRNRGHVPRAAGKGGGGADVPPRWRVDEEDPFGRPRSPDDILAGAGVEKATLPADIQEALARGLVTAAELRQWLRIAATPVLGALCRAIPAFRDRVMGNPRFLATVAIEVVIGVTAKTVAEVQGRGKDFWKEIHFVASDIALEVIGDFAVVMLLSPKRTFTVAPTGKLALAVSKLPGHALQAGTYTLPQRLFTVAYRAAQFFGVGFGSSILGHSLTKALVEAQRERDHVDGAAPEKPLAPVLDNSIAWGGFMALSTNARYQLVNGFEEGVLDACIGSAGLKSATSFFLRFGNTFAGGAQWVWYARLVGLQ